MKKGNKSKIISFILCVCLLLVQNLKGEYVQALLYSEYQHSYGYDEVRTDDKYWYKRYFYICGMDPSTHYTEDGGTSAVFLERLNKNRVFLQKDQVFTSKTDKKTYACMGKSVSDSAFSKTNKYEVPFLEGYLPAGTTITFVIGGEGCKHKTSHIGIACTEVPEGADKTMTAEVTAKTPFPDNTKVIHKISLNGGSYKTVPAAKEEPLPVESYTGESFDLRFSGYQDQEANIQATISMSATITYEVEVEGNYLFQTWGHVEYCTLGTNYVKTELSDICVSLPVTYDANGGSGSMSNNPDKKIVGQDYSIRDCEFKAPAGKQFAGWNTKADGSGDAYDPGNSYKKDEPLTLYAQWEPTDYIITYDANGGTGSMEPGTKKKDVDYPIAQNGFTPPEGKVFAGWNTNADGSGTEYAPDEQYQKNESLTLYAQWDCLILYKANGGSGTMPDGIKVKGDPYPIAENEFTPPQGVGCEYDFKNWNTQPDGTGDVYDPQDEYTTDEPLILYAQWESKYIITYNANGGSGSMDIGKKTKDEPYKISQNGFTPPQEEGYLYTFKSWNTKADGTGDAFDPGKDYTENASLILYAQWEKKHTEATLRYDVNLYYTETGPYVLSSRPKPESFSKQYTQGETISLPEISLEGYEFLGWFTQPSGGTALTEGETWSGTENRTVYAHWRNKVPENVKIGDGTTFADAGHEAEMTEWSNTPVVLQLTGADAGDGIKTLQLTDVGDNEMYSKSYGEGEFVVNETYENTEIGLTSYLLCVTDAEGEAEGRSEAGMLQTKSYTVKYDPLAPYGSNLSVSVGTFENPKGDIWNMDNTFNYDAFVTEISVLVSDLNGYTPQNVSGVKRVYLNVFDYYTGAKADEREVPLCAGTMYVGTYDLTFNSYTEYPAVERIRYELWAEDYAGNAAMIRSWNAKNHTMAASIVRNGHDFAFPEGSPMNYFYSGMKGKVVVKALGPYEKFDIEFPELDAAITYDRNKGYEQPDVGICADVTAETEGMTLNAEGLILYIYDYKLPTFMRAAGILTQNKEIRLGEKQVKATELNAICKGKTLHERDTCTPCYYVLGDITKTFRTRIRS